MEGTADPQECLPVPLQEAPLEKGARGGRGAPPQGPVTGEEMQPVFYLKSVAFEVVKQEFLGGRVSLLSQLFEDQAPDGRLRVFDQREEFPKVLRIAGNQGADRIPADLIREVACQPEKQLGGTRPVQLLKQGDELSDQGLRRRLQQLLQRFQVSAGMDADDPPEQLLAAGQIDTRQHRPQGEDRLRRKQQQGLPEAPPAVGIDPLDPRTY